MPEWDRVPLGEVLSEVSRPERVQAEKRYKLLGTRWYAGGLFIKDDKMGAAIQANTLYRVEAGDFVYNRLFAWKGSFATATDEQHGCYVSNEFPCFSVDPLRLDPDYLRYYFMQPTSWTEALGLSSGSTPTSRNRLKEEKLLAMLIPLPPLPEQQRIVARIKGMLAKVEEARGLSQQSRRGLLSNINNIDAFFDGTFEEVRVEDVALVIDPNPSHRYPEYVAEGIPIVSTINFVGENGIDISTAKKIPGWFFEETLGKHGVRSGDVIFSRKGKIGYARPYPADSLFAMTHTLCLIKPNRDIIEPEYLLHFTRSRRFIKYLLSAMNDNVGVPTLGLGVIRSAPIALPTMEEQIRVVGEIRERQNKQNSALKLHQSIERKLDALTPSILARAFAGGL